MAFHRSQPTLADQKYITDLKEFRSLEWKIGRTESRIADLESQRQVIEASLDWNEKFKQASDNFFKSLNVSSDIIHIDRYEGGTHRYSRLVHSYEKWIKDKELRLLAFERIGSSQAVITLNEKNLVALKMLVQMCENPPEPCSKQDLTNVLHEIKKNKEDKVFLEKNFLAKDSELSNFDQLGNILKAHSKNMTEQYPKAYQEILAFYAVLTSQADILKVDKVKVLSDYITNVATMNKFKAGFLPSPYKSLLKDLSEVASYKHALDSAKEEKYIRERPKL